MEGPDGGRQWCLVDFQSIVPQKSFVGQASFCDENGVINHDFPGMNWKNEFDPSGSGTRVTVEISFATQADLEKIIEMGFREGFTAAHGNLDELLAGL
jgi:hypothetical protein